MILLLQNSLLRINYLGSCVTTVLPGDVCGLEGVAYQCDPQFLRATDCNCKQGYQHEEMAMDCTGNVYLYKINIRFSFFVLFVFVQEVLSNLYFDRQFIFKLLYFHKDLCLRKLF